MAFRDLRSRNDKREEVAAERPASPSTPKTTTTYIDNGCELSGQMRFQESVTIDGRIEGEIDCGKMVVVGPSANINARIGAESVVVHGTVEGDVIARRKITLHRSANVTGDMRTSGIVIEEGARFQGRITIGSQEEAAKPASTSVSTSTNTGASAKADKGVKADKAPKAEKGNGARPAAPTPAA